MLDNFRSKLATRHLTERNFADHAFSQSPRHQKLELLKKLLAVIVPDSKV